MQEEVEGMEVPQARVDEGGDPEVASEIPRFEPADDKEEDDDRIPLSQRVLKRASSSLLEEGVNSPGVAAEAKTSSDQPAAAQPPRVARKKL